MEHLRGWSSESKARVAQSERKARRFNTLTVDVDVEGFAPLHFDVGETAGAVRKERWDAYRNLGGCKRHGSRMLTDGHNLPDDNYLSHGFTLEGKCDNVSYVLISHFLWLIINQSYYGLNLWHCDEFVNQIRSFNFTCEWYDIFILANFVPSNIPSQPIIFI